MAENKERKKFMSNLQAVRLEEMPSSAHNFSPEILREYDIRGRVGVDMDEKDAYVLGRAFGTLLKKNEGKRVCIGYDGRTTSVPLSSALAEGLKSTGAEVEVIGLGPTPMLYFAVKDRMADAGIMVTGSHNPADYNGFKMTFQKGPVYGEHIQELGRIAASGEFASGEGSISEMDIKEIYVDRLMKDFTGGREMKIAWDAGNGAAGEIMKMLSDRLPGEHILLYQEIDGTFPNHHPDPTVDKNLEDLIKVVKEQNCDFGIAFDGDGDRLGAVDENGKIMRCDDLMTIYAKDVLEDNQGAPVIGDVKCSNAMFDEIERLGGRPVMWKTGHSLIKVKMIEEQAPLAGELSGHIYFADKYYGFDDALYCAVRLINCVGDTENSFSSLISHLPERHSTPEIRIEVEESEKFAIVPKIAEIFKAHEGEEFKIDETDGVRISTPEGWFLIRASNTQNVLVSRVEANSADVLEKLKGIVSKEVEALGYEFKVE
jgi:phosphomannomutase